MELKTRWMMGACALLIVQICPALDLKKAVPQPEPFRPLTFAFECSPNSSNKHQILKSADLAMGGIEAVECADGDRMASNIVPLAVTVDQESFAHNWVVELKLSTRDAKRLTALTTPAQGGRLLLIVSKKVLYAGYSFAVFTGDQWNMTVSSKDEGRKLESMLLSKG